MKYLLIALLAASTAAHAQEQEYVFKDQPFESGYLSTDGKTFSINTVNSSGNLCNLEGRLNNNVYRDGEGCEVRFTFARNKVNVTVPESAREACEEYCGLNAHFVDQYYRLPAACTESAAKNTTQRFQAAYRAKNYAQAAQIQQQYVNTCNSFMFITGQMRARNDLAVAYKNSGNKTACRTALQPLRRYWNDKADDHTYLYRDDFMKELAAAKFNWNECR
ncbi:hypothetical protein [Kingella denitrificans]|uniref:hypothetical protein n=1 Tax=Kingella denitrificans TaxID=502 RepID=UPI0021C4C324|nr:hypothetical protein [Kingella denitrificans]